MSPIRNAFLIVLVALAAAALLPASSSAWAPAKSATVHPGVQVFTDGAQCTANFVFAEGSSVYLGQAAHCSGTGGATETDGGPTRDGGPTGVGAAGGFGSDVYSYGNSSLRGGITKLSPKQGGVAQSEGGGWSHVVVTLTPGVPGDSGSGFLNRSGEAIGVLSTLQIAPLAGTNGVGDLGKELAYMRAHSRFAATQLVRGTEPFKADLAGAILGS